MITINITTPDSIIEQLKIKLKQMRLSMNLTQDGLAKRSGVSLGSLKRFESSGNISLKSLLKLSLVLECLDDFQNIANPKKEVINSLDDILNTKVKSTKKRGTVT
ncbi:MAG: helix-turn-helix transcriptional regulator [Campylobacterota bacterium]|nr:helix-turn-helix transcriptional regulator [Campylobacterota bacterium]